MAPAKKTRKEAATKPSREVPATREERHPPMALRADIHDLFDSFVRQFPSFGFGRSPIDWDPFRSFDRRFGAAAPRVDVSETEKGYEVVAELPGLAEKDVNLELKDDVLTLSGEKQEERKETKKDYHISERTFGSFRRSFRLPAEIDQNKISAEFKDGVLSVSLPKTATAQKPSKKIAIKS